MGTFKKITADLRLKASSLVNCCIITLLLVLPSVVHAEWTIQGVDTPRHWETMSSRSIAIDKTTGHPHIVYGGDHLYHAYYNGTQWVFETVDASPLVGKAASIAIDSNGKVHISYPDKLNGSLKYATNVFGVWMSITVDTDAVRYNENSIAVDSSNNVHIGYHSAYDDLKYATNATGSWVTATVDSTSNFGSYVSIAADSNGKAHISYYDSTNSDLKYATNATGSWVKTTVDSTGYVGSNSSIAVDSSNKAHIAYDDATNSDLKYATNATGSWVKTTVDGSTSDVGSSASIAIDSSNKLHISYYDSTNADLKYATNATGSWVKTTVDGTGLVGWFSSIALDGSNKAHISYTATNLDLKYVTNTTGSWVKTTVDSVGSNVGYYSSIAVDSNKKGHISYYDATTNDLKYATNATGSWVAATVGSTGIVGQYSSIAVDSNNKVHISYYDGTNYDLKYATNISGSWVTATIDSTGIVGQYSSIAVDSNNKVHISYYDGTNKNLKYATNASGSWATTTVDANSWDTAGSTSIAIDSSNKVHISYYDSTNFDLGYATNLSGSWVISWPDVTGDVGYYNSIAVDSGNKAHISYQDATNIVLKYATNTSGSWVTTTVDNTSGVGWNASIAVDSGKIAHISYHYGLSADLKYATNASGGWVATTVDSDGWVGDYSSIAVDGENKAHISYYHYYDESNGDLKYATNAPIDITPPVGGITISIGDFVYTNTATVTLYFYCADLQSDCSQMQFSNDGTSWSTPEVYYELPGTKSWDITASAYGGTSSNGLKSVYVRFRDASGNWSAPYSDTITLDSVPPNAPSVTGTTPTSDSTPTWTWNSGGGGGNGTFRYKLDNSNLTTGATETNSLNYTPGTALTNAAHTLYVQERDEAGSWSGSGSFAITVDTTPPNTPSVTGTTPTNDSKPLWSWTSNGGGGNGTFRYKLDNADLTTGATTTTSLSYIPASALSDGAHTLYVQEKDALNNWSGSGSFAVTVDTTPPNAPSVTGTTPTNDSTPSWSWTSNGGGNGTFRYKLDNADLTTGATTTTSVSYTPASALSDGAHTLYVQEKDTLSNWSTSGSFTISIDSTPPNAPSVTGTTPTNNTRPAWSWTSNGGGGNGTFRYKLDDSNLSTGAAETTATDYTPASDLTEGAHTLYVQERDAVGNWSASGSFSVMIDITQPDSPIVTGTTPTNSARPAWNWSSTGGNTNFRYRLDNADLTVGATTTTSTSYAPAYDLPEGPHTLYVQEQDPSGNWSISDSHTILIDITAPSGGITINSGAADTKDPNVTLGLTCNDGNGSGCSQMQISDNNGTSWTAPEAIAATKAWVLSGDGDKTIYVKFKDAAGNWSGDTAISDGIKLDTTAPVTAPSAGTGNYATTQIVALECGDGTGTGCAGTYFTTNGNDPDETNGYSSPITINSDTILKFYSKDNLGNTETVKTQTYTFTAGYTELTFELSVPTIDQGGSLVAWGRLHNMNSNGADPTGETITLNIIDPNGVPQTPVTVQIYNNLGDFYFEAVTGFTLKGVYTLYASFGGSGLLAASDSSSLPLLVGASAGYAVIVEGKINQSGASGEASHNKTANRIYQRLKARGFVDDNIYYFNYLTQAGVDGKPLKAVIQYAVEEWAQPRMNGMPAPLYIIMVDHGSTDFFHIDDSDANTSEDNDTISPADLNTWLTTLEYGLNAEALLEKRVVIIGACYSGSFIDELSQGPSTGNGGRVVITSSAEDEVSYKGPMEGDNIRSGEFFLEELFTRLEHGNPIRQAFEEATEATEIFTWRGGEDANANAPYYDGAVQHPMLDDNGDAQGSNRLGNDPTEDGPETEDLKLGVGVDYNINSAETPADITEVTVPVYLDSTTTSATLWARVNHDEEVDSAPWVEIRTPSMVLNPQAGSGQEELALTRIPLTLNQATGVWETNPPLTSFAESGKYEVYYFVRDQETKKLSPMKRSVVYKDSPANMNPPGAFHLISPADGSEQLRKVILEWEASGDPDGDEVTYTVMISQDNTFATIDYIKTDIKTTWALVGENGELLIDTLYYWKVVAVDPYGKHRESSQVLSFHTNCGFDPENCNGTAFPGIITGYVYVNGTNPAVPIANATITTSNGRSATSGANG
ncbi:MAG: chitobiase/beta-hexosaminidase C-terminal domain-containing protein, partial [Nitrospirae bacterium]|nr:chitobiase/beta-hexosaminidase C-terminal domain-containing protein [Nitrospirota bacterium]